MTKYFFVALLFFVSCPCFAEETAELPPEIVEAPRIKMASAPDGQEMQKLMDRVSNYCNSGDFVQFMNCFTKKKASSIRKTMKAVFTKHNNVTMTIVFVDPIFSEEDVVKFNLEYVWDADNVVQKSIINSTITAKKENDSWKIDKEEVKDITHVSKKEDQPMQINFGGAGQVAFDANDDLLPRDIAKRPGGCANGQCNVK